MSIVTFFEKINTEETLQVLVWVDTNNEMLFLAQLLRQHRVGVPQCDNNHSDHHHQNRSHLLERQLVSAQQARLGVDVIVVRSASLLGTVDVLVTFRLDLVQAAADLRANGTCRAFFDFQKRQTRL